jgi:hypothetical protein
MLKELTWLIYFNPCGSFLVGKYGNRFCESSDCGHLHCLKHKSFLAAGALIRGGNIPTERRELSSFLEQLVSKQVIDINGQNQLVNSQNIPELTDTVLVRANKIIDGIESCMQNTIPIDENTVSTLPFEERKIMFDLSELTRRTANFSGNETAARQLALEIKEKLRLALKFDLGRLDLIARQSLAYGLADEMPSIDNSGLIFMGEPRKITKLS